MKWGYEPLYFAITLPIPHLTLRVIPYLVLQLFKHFFFGQLLLEEEREVAVLEAELVHAFVRETARVKCVCFFGHACFHALEKSGLDFSAQHCVVGLNTDPHKWIRLCPTVMGAKRIGGMGS